MTVSAPPRPSVLPVDPAGIHPELIEHDAWVVWRLEPKPKKPGEWTKVPYRASDPTRKASSTDHETWASFSDAFMAYQANPTLDGIGIVLHDTGIVGIDLDNAIAEDGAIKPWAQDIVDSFPGAYWERSPSGKGLRGLCRGELPPGRRKAPYQDGTLEMYDEGRFLTITGAAL